MPIPARTAPRVQLPGAVRLRRIYVDHLQRPLSGTVLVISREPAAEGDMVIPAGPTPVDLSGGVLDIPLPPGRYRLVAQLRAADGSLVRDDREITLEPDQKAE